MTDIYKWSTTADSNNSSDSAINWSEGQAPSTVNNSARAMMGRVAELVKDLGGTVTAGGTANGLTVTANSAFTTLANGRIIAFIAASDNTTAATLNVNSIGAKSLRKMTPDGDAALAGGEIQAGSVYLAVYNTALNGGSGGWLLINPTQAVLNLTDGSYIKTASEIMSFAGASGGYAFDALVWPATNDGAPLGTTSFSWSDLFLASGGVINFANGDFTITHADNELTFANDGTTRAKFTSTGRFFLGGSSYTGAIGEIGINLNGVSGTFAITSDNTSSSIYSTNNTAGDYYPLGFFLSGSQLGYIRTTSSGTEYNTTSDERLKDFTGEFSPSEAVTVIRADPVRMWDWKNGGGSSLGWGAQTSYQVSPHLATPGNDIEPGEPGHVPWAVDKGARTPYLWAALSWALDRIDDLEARLAAVEAQSG